MTASTHQPILVGPAFISPAEPAFGAHTERDSGGAATASEQHSFDSVYRAEFAFVWRSAKRLGLHDAALDDAVQEVFVVVHRRLADFEGRSSVRTWLFGITLRVVRDHRRSARRRDPGPPVDPDTLRARDHGPAEIIEQNEKVRVLHALLDELDDERREVFVMVELEQMAIPEVANVLGINVNTAYARLRLARQEFEQALARHRAREAHDLAGRRR